MAAERVRAALPSGGEWMLAPTASDVLTYKEFCMSLDDTASQPAESNTDGASSHDDAGGRRPTLPDPDGTRGAEPRFSPSAIEAYQACPRKFYYQYVARADGRERPSPVLCQASAIHEALDRFFGLRPEERNEETIHRALRSVWPNHRRPGAFANREQEAEWGRAGLEMLSSFLEHFDSTGQPISREGWVSAQLPNGAEVFGKVDRVDEIDQGLDVIDYKTGKISIDEAELGGLPATQVYALGAAAEHGRPVARVRFVFLKAAQELRHDIEDEDIEAIRDKLVEITGEIMAEREFPTRPGEACRWCPFSYACPDANRVEISDLEVSEDLPF
jgi:RecB family exonuclease